MSTCSCLLCAAVTATVMACGTDTSATPPAPAKVEGHASTGFYGVDPSIFRCETLLPLGEVARAVGGEVQATPSMFRAPTGTPAPCDFRQLHAPAPPADAPDGGPAPAQRMWSVRFDCRDSYLPSTTKEMQRLLTTDGSTKVAVGKWGVDRANAALVFLDDDTPCSVRVIGPGASERAAIGRLVATKLTLKTAPMAPRPAPMSH